MIIYDYFSGNKNQGISKSEFRCQISAESRKSGSISGSDVFAQSAVQIISFKYAFAFEAFWFELI